jgi:hypothetical protein
LRKTHPIEVWDDVLKKNCYYRTVEEQKAMESLPLGLRVLLLSKAAMKLKPSEYQKVVVFRQKNGYGFNETIYTKRAESGEIYTRNEKAKIMKHFISKSTLLHLPDGETWDLRGETAIKFPSVQNEPFVKRALEKGLEERKKAVESSKNPKDRQHAYLCEIFSEGGKDCFRVVVTEPKIHQKIKDSLAGDVSKGMAGSLDGRIDDKAGKDASEMLKANATQRKEHIIDRHTLLPVAYNEYNSRGKKQYPRNTNPLKNPSIWMMPFSKCRRAARFYSQKI